LRDVDELRWSPASLCRDTIESDDYDGGANVMRRYTFRWRGWSVAGVDLPVHIMTAAEVEYIHLRPRQGGDSRPPEKVLQPVKDQHFSGSSKPARK